MKLIDAIIHALGGYTKKDAVPKIETDIENPLWFLKGYCAMCACQKIEWCCDRDYIAKYPPRYKLRVGAVNVCLCEYHARQMKDWFVECFKEEE